LIINCISLVLDISEEIRKSIIRHKVVISVLGDGFLEVCKAYGFDDKSCGLVRAMLTNVTQRIKFDDMISDVVDLLDGIFQGTNVLQYV